MNNTNLFTNVFKSLFGSSITPTASQFVPITAQDGTPAGVSSMANLASVLGAKYVTNITIISNDCNDIRSNGYYAVTAASQISNLPETKNGMLHVIRWDNAQQAGYGNVYQYYYSDTTHIVWFRNTEYGNNNTSSFGTWAKMSPGSFLNDYSELRSLASALGGEIFDTNVFSGNCNDLAGGKIVVTVGATNSPGDYYHILTLGGPNTDRAQIAVLAGSGDNIIKERGSNGNVWGEWKQIQIVQ